MPVNDTLFDQGGAVHNVRNSVIAMDGTGAADTGAKFAALAPAHYVVPAGTYKISASSTIPAGVVLELMKGAKLRPAAGATVTIAGPVLAGPYQIFDFSLGGSVRFTGNTSIAHYLPQWFGVVGSGAVNEVPALDAMVASIPDFAHVEFSPGLRMRLDSVWRIYQRSGIEFSVPGWAPLNAEGATLAAEFIWNGAAHGTMVELDRCQYLGFAGFLWRLNAADCAIDIDMFSPSGQFISTQNFARRNEFVAENVKNAALEIIRLAKRSQANAEYNHIEENVFRGYGNGNVTLGGHWDFAPYTVHTVSGQNTLVFVAGHPKSPNLAVGKRIRIAGVGPLVNGVRSGLDTTITSVTDSTHATMADTAQATGDWYWVLDEVFGRGVTNGLSYNAKRQTFRRNHFAYLAAGIESAGGSLHSVDDNFIDCEECIIIAGNQSEPSTIDGLNMEHARRLLRYEAGTPVLLRGARFGINLFDPVRGSIVFNQSSANLVIVSSANDSITIPPGTRLFDVRSAESLSLTTMGNTFSENSAKLGLLDFVNNSAYRHVAILDLVDKPGIIERSGTNVSTESNKLLNRWSGTQIFGLPAYDVDDASLFNGPLAGSSSPSLVIVPQMGPDGIIKRRTKRTDGSLGTAFLPVDTTDLPFTGSNLAAFPEQFGRRVLITTGVDGSWYEVRGGIHAMPAGTWVDVYKDNSSSSSLTISTSEGALVNGLTYFRLATHRSGVRLYSRGGGIYDAILLNVAPKEVTWNPPSLASGAQTTTVVAYPGAEMGAQVMAVSFDKDLQGMHLWGYVSSANNVTVVLRNGTGGTIDLPSGTLKVSVNPLTVVT